MSWLLLAQLSSTVVLSCLVTLLTLPLVRNPVLRQPVWHFWAVDLPWRRCAAKCFFVRDVAVVKRARPLVILQAFVVKPTVVQGSVRVPVCPPKCRRRVLR